MRLDLSSMSITETDKTVTDSSLLQSGCLLTLEGIFSFNHFLIPAITKN